MIEDGVYIVKDGVLYEITPKIQMPFSKRVNVMTGEVYYPSNADRIRAMTGEELAEWIAKDLIEPGYDTYDRTYQWWLTWLKKEASDGSRPR